MNVRGFVTVANIGNALRLVGGLCVWLAIIAGSAVAQTGGWRDSDGRTKGNGTDARQIRPGIQAFIPGVDRVADAEEPDMAETYWNSSASQVWNNAANWTAGVPGVGDVAIFDGRSNVSVSGYDASADGLLTRIRIHRAYQGSIGSTGNPLNIPFSNLAHLGSGAVHIYIAAAPSPYVQVDSAHPMSSDALHLTGATVAELDVLRGRVTYNAAGTTADISIDGGKLILPAIPGNAVPVSRLSMSGGELDSGRVIERMSMHGGTTTIRGALADNVLEVVWVYGGTLNVLDDIPLYYVVVHGGIFDITQCTSSLAVTKAVIFPGGDFAYNQESYSGITLVRDLRNDFP